MSCRLPRFVCVTLLAATALGLGGCAGHSDFMTKVPVATAPVAPAPNVATIVFVRNSGFGFAVNFSILDQDGNMLGDAVARSHFSLQVPPGRYFFFARGGENTDAVQADVAAGCLYHIHVVPHLGALLARVELDPIKPNEKEWALLPGWLSQSNRLAPLIPRTPVRVEQGVLPEWASKAWASLSAVEQAAHTLNANDGRAATPKLPTSPLGPVATAP